MKDLSFLKTAGLAEALYFLCSFSNAMDYNEKKLLAIYRKGTTVSFALGNQLCGTSGAPLVEHVIKGNSMYLRAFLENVSYNSVDSVPFIMKVLQMYITENEKYALTVLESDDEEYAQVLVENNIETMINDEQILQEALEYQDMSEDQVREYYEDSLADQVHEQDLFMNS